VPGPSTTAEPILPTEIDPAEATRAGEAREDNGLGIVFRYCPAGSFSMGGATGRSGPVRVTLTRGFWMAQDEASQGHWLALMGRTLRQQRAQDPTQPRPVGDGSTRDHVGEGPDHPIYYVSHAEAVSFCEALTEAERSFGRLPEGWIYRLPTEAEWEHACRAATTSATAFGESLGSDQANFDGRWPFNGAPKGPFLRETTPSGTFPPNAWGLRDMHGNVCEWCLDAYSDSPPGGVDPLAHNSSPERVFKGGSWDLRGSQCLSSQRSRGATDTRGSGLGFRPALVPMDLPPPP
jgi:formylglycine-generating enzyme required for sulfatase activity